MSFLRIPRSCVPSCFPLCSVTGCCVTVISRSGARTSAGLNAAVYSVSLEKPGTNRRGRHAGPRMPRDSYCLGWPLMALDYGSPRQRLLPIGQQALDLTQHSLATGSSCSHFTCLLLPSLQLSLGFSTEEGCLWGLVGANLPERPSRQWCSSRWTC